MQEEKPKQQPTSPASTNPSNTSDVKSEIKERKVRVGEDTPSRFGQTSESPLPQVSTAGNKNQGLPLVANSFDGILTFSPESVVLQPRTKVEVNDEKEQKNHSPSSAPIQSQPISTPLTTEPSLDVKETKSKPVVGGVKFPVLQAALKAHYGAQGTLQLPLSGQRFPIKDVSLTISDKSEQDKREKEKARQLAE